MSDNNNVGGGLRFDKGKTRHELIPQYAQKQYALVLTKGAEKYAPRNWEKGMQWSKVLGSLKRHLAAFEAGEDFDSETGLLHTAHIMCNAGFLTEYYKIFPMGDDRPHVYRQDFKIGLDIDEVICDWVKGWVDMWNMDVPNNWFFDSEINERFAELKDNGKLDEFYLNLKPKIKPIDIPFEPHCYITSRPVDTSITMKWLEMHGFPIRPIFTVGLGTTKVQVAKDSGIDIYVDDRYDNFIELNNNGICTYLMDAPHNQRYNVGARRIKSLNELCYSLHK